MYFFPPQPNPDYARYRFFEGLFSPPECEKIISYFDPEKSEEAGVQAEGKIVPTTRKSRVTWLYPQPDRKWLWEKLTKHIAGVNQAWRFDLDGLLEALQLTEYGEAGHYNWHEDNTESKHSTRKLSFSLQLTDPSTYDGGDLVLYPDHRPPRTQGTLIFFPSYYLHKVEPVTRGTRHSLVSWVTGRPFR